MPHGVAWRRPAGGLFLWLTLPEGHDGAALLERSLAEAGVAFVPGAAFFFDGRGRNAVRLSFSLPGETDIERGIRCLGKLIEG
jgi:DNA-binding transcriptional MocR family regulator